MATSPFFTVRVGSGSPWTELPIGTYVEGFRHQKKKNIRQFPLGHGGVNVADRKYMPGVLEVVVEIFETAGMNTAATEFKTVLSNLEDNEGNLLQVWDEEIGAVAWQWTYDEVNDYEVDMVTYTKGKKLTCRFYLDLLAAPYFSGAV